MEDYLEIKRTLTGERKTFRCTRYAGDADHVVIRYDLTKPARVADLELPPGTITLAYYWTDRPYNVYHWIGPDGATLACYFNIARHTVIRPDAVEWDDLAVDVLVTPDGRVQVLDEDELPADLDPTAQALIRRTVAHLRQHHRELVATIQETSCRLLNRESLASP